jgi:hypothetical protein
LGAVFIFLLPSLKTKVPDLFLDLCTGDFVCPFADTVGRGGEGIMNRFNEPEAFQMWAMRWLIAIAALVEACRILFLHKL